MNPRLFKIANFFAFNLLFFALYLNFVHKDKNVQQAYNASVHAPVATSASTGSAAQYVQKEQPAKHVVSEKRNTKPLKLSFN